MSVPRWFRITVLLAAIVALLGVSVAAASPAHMHAKPPANGCDICFTAHFASSEAKTLAIAIAAPEVRNRAPQCAEAAGYHLLLADSSSTRGPPASL